MGTALIGILIVGVSVVLSVVGLIVVRRSVPLSFLETHHEVAGFFIGVLGVIYAVLLGFVVFVVWDQFEETKVTVAQEANQLGDLSRMAKAFPKPIENRIREGIMTYMKIVINEEWSTMSRGEESPRAWNAMKQLWGMYREINPQTLREQIVLIKSIDKLNDLSDSRKLRLRASHDSVPMIMWILLCSEGAITIVFTYFFGVTSIRSQALMTAALTTIIVLTLFLIFAIDYPFSGDVKVTPEPFQEELERITNQALE